MKLLILFTLLNGFAFFSSSQIHCKRFQRVVLDSKLKESSGLFILEDTLWSHNDSGNDPYLFAIDAKGNIKKAILMPSAYSDDWEDACTSSTSVFIADIGNNRGNKDTLRINKFPKSLLQSGKGRVEVIHFSYSDSIRKARLTIQSNFNSEALVYFSQHLFLFSKNRTPGKVMVYSLPDSTAYYLINPIDSFELSGEITSADVNPRNGRIIFCGYRHFVPFIAIGNISENGKVEILFRKSLFRYRGRQIEAVLWDPNNEKHFWLSSENSKYFRQSLISVYLR